jgi:hypothetical protein
MATMGTRHKKFNRRFGRRALAIATAAAIVAALSLTAMPALAGDPGDAGALFLRVGMGARPAGMAEAYTAVAEDATTVYWNPAAMAAVLSTNVMLMHNEYFQSVRLEQAALTHETKYGTLGFSFTGLYMDDLELREDVPSEIPLGTYSVYDVSFAVAFARYIVPNTSLGIAVKPIYEKIAQESATGLAFDLGVFHVSRIEGLKLAAVVGNVGAPMKFIEEEFALPRYVKIGGAYERESNMLHGQFLFTLDAVFPNDDDARQHVGAEYMYDRLLSLRAGYKAGYDSQGATFGMGIRYKSLDVDYAYMLISNDLGDSQRISLSIRL